MGDGLDVADCRICTIAHVIAFILEPYWIFICSDRRLFNLAYNTAETMATGVVLLHTVNVHLSVRRYSNDDCIDDSWVVDRIFLTLVN